MNYTCFTCNYWNGTRRKDRAYCKKLFLGGKDATSGDDVCTFWEKRINARMPEYKPFQLHRQQIMKIYIVFQTRNYETEIVGVFESLELAKIEQQKKPGYHYIQEFVLNMPNIKKYI